MTISAVPSQIACFGNKGSVSLSTTGGTPPLSYNNVPTANLSAGTYTYIVTDAVGCTAQQSVTINPEPSVLNLNATATQIACFNGRGSVALNPVGGTSPYTYGLQSTTNLGAGIYSFTVTDNHGCTASASSTN
jgi:hypothetical protein